MVDVKSVPINIYLCVAGLMVHAEAQGSPSPIDATLMEDVMSILYLIYLSAHTDAP